MPDEIKTKTIEVLESPLAATDYRGAYELVVELGRRGDRAYLVEAANTHVVAMNRHDRGFQKTMDSFDLWLPDGMPLIWSMNRKLPKGERLADRVYGPTFMLKAFEWSESEESASHYLMGGSEEMLRKLVENLSGRFPKAKIAGSYSPPFGDWGEQEDLKIASKIRESGARFIWIGLGCPKQENWLSRMKEQLPPGVYFGIGAAFAFHAGEVKQAPAFLQKYGLEWAYRLFREPRRLFKRYFVYNSLFIFYSLRGKK